MTMKAVLVQEFAPLQQARVIEVEDPVPGKGEVVVDVLAAESVTCRPIVLVPAEANDVAAAGVVPPSVSKLPFPSRSHA